MPLTTDMRVYKILVVIFLVLTGLLSLIWYFNQIFITLVVGCILIVIVHKLLEDYYNHMDKLRFSKTVRRGIGWIVAIFWIAVFIHFMSGSFADIVDVYNSFDRESSLLTPAYREYISQYVPERVVNNIINEDNIRAAESYVLNVMSSVISNVSYFLVNSILIIPLMMWMYFKHGSAISKAIFNAVPTKFRKGFGHAVSRMESEFDDFFTAKIIESVVVGALCCFGFYIAGLQGWLLLGFVAGFLNIIPYLGPFIGAIPPIMVSLAMGDQITLIIVVITVIIAQLVDNLYLIPFMISDKVSINPLIGIILILTMAQLLGVMGMIFAIPIYSVYRIILTQTYVELVRGTRK